MAETSSYPHPRRSLRARATALSLSRPEKGRPDAVSSLSRPTARTRPSLSRPGGLLLAGGFAGSFAFGGALPRIPERFLRRASYLLLLIGMLVLIDAGVTLVWQEPFSGLYASLQQEHLRNSLDALDRAAPAPAVRSELKRVHRENQRIALLASAFQRKAKNGSAVGRIEIPRIKADFVMVKGTDTADLEKGPGIYSNTNFPGIAGTTAIAGHRTTYLAPFRHIDELRKGDRIVIRMPYARFVYRVTGQRSVLPNDVRAAVDYVGYTRLVLSACTPPFSAAERLLVYARVARIQPLGAARHLEATSGAQSLRPFAPARRAAARVRARQPSLDQSSSA